MLAEAAYDLKDDREVKYDPDGYVRLITRSRSRTARKYRYQDTERVRQVLTNALTPMVEALLQQEIRPPQNDEEWNELANQLIETFAAAAPPDLPVLSNNATSRAGIYEEHP